MPVYQYTIKTQKAPLWRVATTYVDPFTKQSKQLSKRGFTTRREAKEFETAFMSNLSKGVAAVSPRARFTDVYEAYCHHIKGKELSPDTIETKDSIIKHYILPYFSSLSMDEITEHVCMEWKAHMLKQKSKSGRPFSDTYLRTIQNQLNAILNYAVKRGYISVSPMLDVKKLGSKRAPEKQTWTVEEFMRFGKEAMDRPATYYLFQLYFWCGLRRGEGLGLYVSDVHFKQHPNDQSYICISKSKNSKNVVGKTKTPKSNRILVLPDFLADELREYIDSLYDPRPNDLLFNVSTHAVYRDFYTAQNAAGLKKIRVHDLRHSYTSMLINSQLFSTTDISSSLGHSSVAITQSTYSHMLEPTKALVAAALDNIRKEH